MFRSSFCALVLFLCQFSQSNAQQTAQAETLISEMWAVYENRCALALTDPQGFLDTLPPTNSRGGPNAALTADQAILLSATLDNGFIVDVEMVAQSDGLSVSCHVFLFEQRFAQLETIPLAAIEMALNTVVQARGLNKPSGGAVRNVYSGPQDGEVIEFAYAVEGEIAGRRILTRFEMTEGDMGVFYSGVAVGSGN